MPSPGRKIDIRSCSCYQQHAMFQWRRGQSLQINNYSTRPLTIEGVMSHCRDSLISMIIWRWNMDIMSAEDFLHEFYLAERRRRRFRLWSGSSSLFSWVLHTMELFHHNIMQGWRLEPIPDGTREWDSWRGARADSTSMEFDWPITVFQLRDRLPPETVATMDHMLADKPQHELDPWKSVAHIKCERMHDECKRLL